MSKKVQLKILKKNLNQLAVCGLALSWMNRIVFNNLPCHFVSIACRSWMNILK